MRFNLSPNRDKQDHMDALGDRNAKLTSHRVLIVSKNAVPEKVMFLRLDQLEFLILKEGVELPKEDLTVEFLIENCEHHFDCSSVNAMAEMTVTLVKDTLEGNK